MFFPASLSNEENKLFLWRKMIIFVYFATCSSVQILGTHYTLKPMLILFYCYHILMIWSACACMFMCATACIWKSENKV